MSNIFSDYSTGYDVPLMEELERLKSKNICDYLPTIKEEEKILCSVLDKGIAETGIKAVLLHGQEIIRKLILKIKSSKNIAKTLINLRDNSAWKNFEIAFQNIYADSYMHILEKMNKRHRKMVTEEITTILENGVNLNLIFSISSLWIIVISIQNILR